MMLTQEDIDSYFRDKREEWEFAHHGQEYPLQWDGKGQAEKLLEEIEITMHLRGTE